jgi:uncharacterized membrane protein YeaQ/YmgE (transglycosylase-associated protein family)
VPQAIDAAIRPRGQRQLDSALVAAPVIEAAIPGKVAQSGTAVSTYSSRVNTLQPKSAGRILVAVTLCSSCAIDAYGFSPALFLYPSIQQQELTMSFLAWVVLGLAAGFVGGRLAKRSGKSIMADVLLGLLGAVAGGWLFYAFGPPGVNGFHLFSHFAAFIGSLIVLLTYYAFRRV